MKIYCQYSGINFQTSHLNWMPEQSYVHPIFATPVSQLLRFRGSYFAGKIPDPIDQKLIFLALLNSTEQVEFHYPASPSEKIVHSNFPSLFDHVDWILRLKIPSLVLPRFRITKESAGLENLKYWFECWDEERKRFETGYSRHEHDKKQAERERILERNIKNPTKRTEQYLGLLATWALAASNAPDTKRKYWRELFLLKPPALYSANPDHIQELHDFLEAELESGSIYSHKALWYIRGILKKVRSGWSGVLGILEDDNEDTDSLTGAFRIDDDLQRANTLSIISNAPTVEPTRNLYPSESSFLKAQIAWKMKKRMMEETRQADRYQAAIETGAPTPPEDTLPSEEDDEDNLPDTYDTFMDED